MQKNMKPRGTIFAHVIASIPRNVLPGAVISPASLEAAATTADAAGRW
jgi:hypothetical protein